LTRLKPVQQKAQLLSLLKQSKQAWDMLEEELNDIRQSSMEQFYKTEDKKYQLRAMAVDVFFEVVHSLEANGKVHEYDK